MSANTNHTVRRRDFVRGMGATIAALPVANAMVPGSGSVEAMPLQGQRIPESVITQERIPEAVIAGFRDIHRDVASICDVLIGLNLQNCISYGVVRPLDPTHTICGPARTMRLIPLQDPEKPEEEQHPGSLMVEAHPGDVVVIDQGGAVDKCIWGGHTATTAKVKQLSGVLIWGATRDSLAIIETGVPHFVMGTTPQHAHGIWRSTNVMSEPVQVGPVSIAPGDLVIGNLDGIVVIPRVRAREILTLARERHEGDQRTYQDILSGRMLFQPPR